MAIYRDVPTLTSVAVWQTISALLKHKQYEAVDNLLAQMTDDDVILTQMIRAVRQVSQACGMSQNEALWYQQNANQAHFRERELAQLLGEMCDAAREYSLSRFEKVPVAVLNPANGHESRFWRLLRGKNRSKAPPNGNGVVRVMPAPDSLRSTLIVYCLGVFRMYYNDWSITNFPGRKAKSVLKYLVLNHARPVGKEVLMELFWPEADPDAARNNLNVAIYSLRQMFREADPDFSYILFKDDSYQLNPDLQLWVDMEAFIEHERAGRKLAQSGERPLAIREYCIADALYQGELFEDDRYEDWISEQRHALEISHINLLDQLSEYYLQAKNYTAVEAPCRKILSIDSCHEGAHCRLMQCYSQQGQYHLALRQYHECVETLQRELGSPPSPDTLALYDQIVARV